MKKISLFTCLLLLFIGVQAQSKKAEFHASADLVSRYIWRGLQLSDAPAIQPTLNLTYGGLTVGTWGSYAFNNYGTECDLYASYAFPFGLNLYLSDYFFPSDPANPNAYAGYFNSEGYNHTLEAGLGYAIKGFSISGYYYLNKTNDVYIEASYTNSFASVFAGAGNEAYTTTGNFNVTNVGFKVFKTIPISEAFGLKPFASFIVNPNKEQVYLVAGITIF